MLRIKFHKLWSGFCKAGKRSSFYLFSFNKISDHNHSGDILVPDHPPEINRRVFLRSLGSNKLSFVLVALIVIKQEGSTVESQTERFIE